MSKSVTISFVGTSELKRLLEQWATEEERSVSSLLRHILKHEFERRDAKKTQEATNEPR